MSIEAFAYSVLSTFSLFSLTLNVIFQFELKSCLLSCHLRAFPQLSSVQIPELEQTVTEFWKWKATQSMQHLNKSEIDQSEIGWFVSFSMPVQEGIINMQKVFWGYVTVSCKQISSTRWNKAVFPHRSQQLFTRSVSFFEQQSLIAPPVTLITIRKSRDACSYVFLAFIQFPVLNSLQLCQSLTICLDITLFFFYLRLNLYFQAFIKMRFEIMRRFWKVYFFVWNLFFGEYLCRTVKQSFIRGAQMQSLNWLYCL